MTCRPCRDILAAGHRAPACSCHPDYHDLGVHAPPEPPRPDDGLAARGKRPAVGHIARATAFYVGVPLAVWAFAFLAIWPRIT